MKRILAVLCVLMLVISGCQSAPSQINEPADAVYEEPEGFVIDDDDPPLASAPLQMSNPSRMELEIFDICNKIRADNGMTKFEWSDELYVAAVIRAGELNSLFSHSRPGGKDWLSVYKEVGISYSLAAENVAIGHSSAQMVVDSWMESSGHRANILGKNTHFAVAAEKCPDSSEFYRGYAFAQLFVVPK